MSHLHAGTRNNKSWEDDPAAVGALAALPRDQRPANAPEGPAGTTSKSAVLAVLKAESLSHFNWFEDRYPRAHEAGIQKVDDGWLVYGSDERAAARYEKVHTDEGQALTDFLDMARFNHRHHWDEDYKRYEQQLFKKSRERRASQDK